MTAEKVMQFTVTKFTELEDGTADVELKMDEETKLYLINYAFVNILSLALNDIEKLHGKGLKVDFDADNS
jgi:hypothetical protein